MWRCRSGGLTRRGCGNCCRGATWRLEAGEALRLLARLLAHTHSLRHPRDGGDFLTSRNKSHLEMNACRRGDDDALASMRARHACGCPSH
ncbi:hypothetical protein NOVOSPHI9U_40503 [Novosphingobium sp. 9U]|nr:hypothetical protein NOVOSPHI9U_40503 [Novosphingobium sp. 9U]